MAKRRRRLTRRPLKVNSVRSSTTLRSYWLRRELGSGGFGEVFRAKDLLLEEPVAVKRFKKTAGMTAKTEEDWWKEHVIHEYLSHPNILQLRDAFEYKGNFYIVTELASCSMDHFVDTDTVFSSELACDAGAQIASALYYLHEGWNPDSPIVHRDLTPKNVFWFEDSEVVKIGDFGISKLLGGPDEMALTQIGNLVFVAPELLELGFTSPESDLYPALFTHRAA